jgi:DNA-binding NarL/FixJ family response regulator
VTVALSSDETKLLQAALRVLVAPLAYPDILTWCTELTARCAEFLRADQALFGMMTSDNMVIVPRGARAADAAASYMRYYWRHDFVVTERRFQLGRETYHRDMLYRPGEIQRCLVYNEWSVPNQFCDTIGMSVEASNPMLAGVHFYHDTEAGNFRERGVDLLDLLLPAFKAGFYTWLALGERRSALTSLLDATGDGVMLASLTGDVLHQTPALGTMIRGDVDGERLYRAMSDAATALGAMIARHRKWVAGSRHPSAPLAREVKTSRGQYRVLASYMPEGTISSQPVIAVTLTPQTPRMLSDEEIRNRFDVTDRQLDVAKLIARGLKNDQVANVLGISKSTALRHTEAVLRKLGVHSRAAVGAALFGGESTRVNE